MYHVSLMGPENEGLDESWPLDALHAELNRLAR